MVPSTLFPSKKGFPLPAMWYFSDHDVVNRGDILPEIRQSVLRWFGCIAGAMEENEYRSKLKSAGFEQIEVEPTRIYRIEDAREFLAGPNIDLDRIASEVDGKLMRSFVLSNLSPAAHRRAATDVTSDHYLRSP